MKTHYYTNHVEGGLTIQGDVLIEENGICLRTNNIRCIHFALFTVRFYYNASRWRKKSGPRDAFKKGF